MYQAVDAPHPPGQPPRYIDVGHPSRAGREELARGLADFAFDHILKVDR